MGVRVEGCTCETTDFGELRTERYIPHAACCCLLLTCCERSDVPRRETRPKRRGEF